ncbi:hypothetical protein [Enterobacter sp. ECC-019]|uniref:hypothetical protein n=1 Tax=Enterobacter sp. ECC-019 TaxID=3116478 RepID=UPI003753EF1A
MNSYSKPCPEDYAAAKAYLHSRKHREQEKLDFCFYWFLVCGVSGLLLWWGTHHWFDLVTQTMGPEDLTGRAKAVVNQWNVLMYFVPCIFFALSAGCCVVWVSGVVLSELLYRCDLLLLHRQLKKPCATAGKGE